jgi:ATP-dependent DNA ligase
VSKRRGSPYRSDRVKSWVKAVCTMRDSFAVIGVPGSPAGALRLARLVEGSSSAAAGQAHEAAERARAGAIATRGEDAVE